MKIIDETLGAVVGVTIGSVTSPLAGVKRGVDFISYEYQNHPQFRAFSPLLAAPVIAGSIVISATFSPIAGLLLGAELTAKYDLKTTVKYTSGIILNEKNFFGFRKQYVQRKIDKLFCVHDKYDEEEESSESESRELYGTHASREISGEINDMLILDPQAHVRPPALSISPSGTTRTPRTKEETPRLHKLSFLTPHDNGTRSRRASSVASDIPTLPTTRFNG